MRRFGHLPPHWSSHWLMLYGNEEFVTKGTVMDITNTRWRTEGPMPVRPGMPLNIWAWPSEKSEGLPMGEAAVLWVNEQEFAVDRCHLLSQNHQCLKDAIEQAECGEVSQG